MPAKQPRTDGQGRGPLIFISYSHKDDQARQKLETHMAQLRREGVRIWYDGDMVAGAELNPTIQRALKKADIFVALASPDYLHSTYCFDKEYGYALRKAGRGKIHVVVALLRACQWRHTRMARYKLLPKDGKPVDQWARRGDAYEDIVEGIRAVVREVEKERSPHPASEGAAGADAPETERARKAPKARATAGKRTSARTGKADSRSVRTPKDTSVAARRGTKAKTSPAKQASPTRRPPSRRPRPTKP